jgi:hypothetical protein
MNCLLIHPERGAPRPWLGNLPGRRRLKSIDPTIMIKQMQHILCLGRQNM